MRPLKLLTLTSRYYLLIFIALLAVFFTAQYTVITREALASIDEVLYNKKVHIIEEFRKNKGVVAPEVFVYSSFTIKPARGPSDPSDHYADTIIYESVDKEWDEFRSLRTSFEYEGKYFDLQIVTPRLETHEIVASIVKSLAIIFLLTVIGFYTATLYFSRRLWRPFYKAMDQLNSFDVGGGQSFTPAPTRIAEFVNLNRSIEELTHRTKRTFVNQKQFIENASHEMQTPLAVLQSKLELLIGDPNLTEDQSGIIQTLINSTQRLSRLNKTLLVLSKIENHQFQDLERLSLEPLISEVLANFEEQKDHLGIQIHQEIQPETFIHTHRMLADLLISNLVKNAFFHNVHGGTILVKATEDNFVIENTSHAGPIPDANLFQRFYKNSLNKESWGLGLAIVKKVCDINHWRIAYQYTGRVHQFEVKFKP